MTELLDGITARRVPTDRLTMNVLERAGADGPAVVFVHGNVSSSLFWQRAMLDLPARYRAFAVDLRGFGDTDPEPVDATRGLRDYADDLRGLLPALGLSQAHLVGWSMGGGVLLQHLLDAPSTVASLTLMAPVSPFGFGGTKGLDGELCHPAGAGSGGGTGNPEFISRLSKRDTSDESPLSPRSVLRAHYVKPGTQPEPEDVFVESMLSTRLGDDHYPGTFSTTEDWPGVLPGDRGVLNTMAPTHFRIADLSGVAPKPPILWVRGTDDVIVSDTSLYDFGYLGQLGAVPGWPGAEVWPPQPMVSQTRAVLEGYGAYREVVLEDAGHGPHLDKPAEFNAVLHEHLGAV